MARSVWKAPFCAKHVIRGVSRVIGSGKLATIIRVYSRSSVILPKFLGLTFGVHNGKDFIPVKVTDDIIGCKFGEFSPTRRYVGHGADKKAVRK